MTTTRTSTGLRIGCAYTRPPPMPSRDAEQIQAALLTKRTRIYVLDVNELGHRAVLLVSVVGLVTVVGALLIGALS